MLLSLVFDAVVAVETQVVVDDRVGAFAIETDLSLRIPQDDGHALPDVVEIQDAQQFVHFGNAHHLRKKKK